MKYSFAFTYALGLAGYANAAPLEARQGSICTAKSLCPAGQTCSIAPGATLGRCDGVMTILPIDVEVEKRGLAPCNNEADCENGLECFPGDKFNYCRLPDLEALDANEAANAEKRSVGEKRSWLSRCDSDDDCDVGQECRASLFHWTPRCRVDWFKKRDVPEAPAVKQRREAIVEKRGTWLNRCDSDADCASNQRCRASLFHLPRCRVDWLGLRDDEETSSSEKRVPPPEMLEEIEGNRGAEKRVPPPEILEQIEGYNG
ncbi:hypothetical protein LIA77_01791 [Sarocladium implicatum]|nr:hypothetical protein LIA77_01791 [Sarocladium implicatum]